MNPHWWILIGLVAYAACGAIACGLMDGLDASDTDGELYAIAALFGPVVIVGFGLWGLGHLTSKIVRSLRG